MLQVDIDSREMDSLTRKNSSDERGRVEIWCSPVATAGFERTFGRDNTRRLFPINLTCHKSLVKKNDFAPCKSACSVLGNPKLSPAYQTFTTLPACVWPINLPPATEWGYGVKEFNVLFLGTGIH
ncbi:hypothetical protein NPIL_657592 [Nephila pilipes]|uniref:Uncharacterized protein n=2 Tax=Nephila pilipes TaxID=299642 RepID=A0A8X6NC84_NEPPI|nr:hypothetical protein NPIL_657592 [Nephila pilipes]